MAMIAKNNAFGTGAPSWDLSFPAGALTAAEITAYCPHWLKSIDIINRFLCHGARTIHIAALLNEFRNFPDDRVFNTNSTLVMMSYAMRKAGFDGWTVTKHFDFTRDHFLPESGLNVTNFRTPCMTQPRNATSQGSNHSINQGVRPVAFKDLAKHVKKHPSGDDALDLARCVQYAVEHLDEVWLFPIDFQRLTAHLGGPATITPAHLDEQVFARRDDIKFPATKRKRSAAIKPTSNNKQPSSKPPTKMRKFINVLSTSGPSQPRKRGNDHLSKDTNSADGYEDGHEENEPFGQLAKKRKLPRGRSMFNSYVNDDEFLPDEAGTNGNIPTRDFSAPEQDELPQSEVDRSITLRKAREGKRAAVEPDTAAPQPDVEPNLGSPHLFEQYIQQYTESDVQLNTATTAVADTAATDSTIANTLPALLTPPIQPANHLQITEQNLHNYARRPFINISDMWNTALDYMRFDGPRQSAPYRELHTLGELNKNDISDWAENIRFAREQWVQFGTIWTEFEGHLEKIRKARLDWGWKSPEAIRVDANKASQAA
ncbi:hypothetical protein COCMIDRAFT_39540 [Bipolaris oryzae ATCC 44560]|uniref:Uncharacterized protein n=1 Tax=Bipolaris oryzae ATCC 44560 TaxID=930090 RepID=W6YXS6_COCMI|nr:uncharacterized protein COCMIDRAFT_39540 [Bipolaris oryzae ATCC 44560]EUC42370.1 hypothetical protein COCMIDRAFT_39540 [Bipolaris oryzae ATCC 44560]